MEISVGVGEDHRVLLFDVGVVGRCLRLVFALFVIIVEEFGHAVGLLFEFAHVEVEVSVLVVVGEAGRLYFVVVGGVWRGLADLLEDLDLV
jgi:hypothetical protein